MHAIRLHTFGPAENLTYEQTDDPAPAPGQVRIAVRAAGVHLLDTALREGQQGPLPRPTALPTIPGREVAGVVESLGDGVAELWLGKRVTAHLGFAPGGYAELAVTDVDRVHEIPGNLDFAQAVAMIGTGRTAMGILQFAELGPDSVAVIPAAAGGIGTLLVQYAKNAGATVVGLAGGPSKTAQVHANGADLAVDYKDSAWPGKVRAFLGGGPPPWSSTAWAARSPASASPSSAARAGTSSSAGPARGSTTAGPTSSKASPSRSSGPSWHRRPAGRTRSAPSNCAPSPKPPRAVSPLPYSVSRSPTRPPRTGRWRPAARPERWSWSHDTSRCDSCRFMVF